MKLINITFRLVIFFLVLIWAFASQAEEVKTLSLQFERKVIQEGKKELSRGIVYYDASEKKVTVKVTYPILQLMVIKGKKLELYYPTERKAFRFKSQQKVSLLFVDTIMHVMQADYGLTELGYSLQKHGQKGETLYTYWQPPLKMRKTFGIAILGTIDDRVVSFEMQTPDGLMGTKSFYRKHVKLANYYIPTEIFSETHNPAPGATQHYEHINYSNLQLNMELPHWVVKFKIPKSVKVKEVKW